VGLAGAQKTQRLAEAVHLATATRYHTKRICYSVEGSPELTAVTVLHTLAAEIERLAFHIFQAKNSRERNNPITATAVSMALTRLSHRRRRSRLQ
jgi:hypothetical protein